MNYIRALIFWLFILVWTPICYLGVEITSFLYLIFSRPRPDNAIHWWAGCWSRVIMRVTPGWHIQVSGKEYLPKKNEGIVVVANHESMVDIWAIYALPFQFRWLSKKEVFKLPMVGRSMRLAGYISVNRGDKESHARALSQCAVWVKSGTSVFFFPEGTRSETAEMRPFKIGAFKLADECGVEILPVVFKGAGKLLRKGSLLPRSATVKIKVLPRVRRLGVAETYEMYAARVRSIIQAEYNKL